MKELFSRLHERLGDLWWYSLMIFIACRSGDIIQAFIGLWLVPKYVTPEELGAVIPLQQLSTLFAVPLSAIAIVFAKYVNTYATRGEYGKVKSFIRDVLTVSCIIFPTCIVAAYLVIPHFYVRLGVVSGMLTILILAAGFTASIAQLFTNALQGLKKFKTMTVQSLISAPIRLVTLLLTMPIRALSGYVLGQTTPPAACSLLAVLTLHQDFKKIKTDTSWRNDLPEIIRYFWPIIMYTACGAIFTAIQTTVYRQRLPEVESAAYYILTKFAETAGYAGTSILVILFPLAAESQGKAGVAIDHLRKSMLGALIPTILITIAFIPTAHMIFGICKEWSIYSDYSSLLPAMAIAAGLQSAILAVAAFEIAAKKFRAVKCFIATYGTFTILLISLTGHGFFRGILPDTLVDFMQSLHVARLGVITYATVILTTITLLLVLAPYMKSLFKRD